jgi:hypothetical protein
VKPAAAVSPDVQRLREMLAPRIPDAEEAQFVAAALPQPDEAAQRRWLAAPDVPSNAVDLQALLHHSLLHTALPLPAEWARRLATASLVEERRAAAIDTLLGPALTCLRRQKLAPLLLGGRAFAAAYPHPALRHTSEQRLLFATAAQRAEASAALCRDLPFRPKDRTGRQLLHEGGFPLELVASTLPPPFAQISYAAMWPRRVPYDWRGEAVAVPNPADALAVLATDAVRAAAGRDLRWLADAWFLLPGAAAMPDALAAWATEPIVGLAIHGLLRSLAALPGGRIAQTRLETLSAASAAPEPRLADLLDSCARLIGRRRTLLSARHWPTRLHWLFRLARRR